MLKSSNSNRPALYGTAVASVQLYTVRVVQLYTQRAGQLELDLFSMLCSHENFTDQSYMYHAWIRSEKISSIRSDACMTPDYARGQPASAWPLAGQPCKVDCDLHTIARAHLRFSTPKIKNNLKSAHFHCSCCICSREEPQ